MNHAARTGEAERGVGVFGMAVYDIDHDSLARTILAASEAEIVVDCGLAGRLVVAEDGPISVVWAPFDHVRQDAAVAIVGMTPGRQQATLATLAFRTALLKGSSAEEALAAAKSHASFAGRMRANLAAMLDHVGLPARLGLRSCSQLFGDAAHLVHNTSALRHPVFVRGDNYAGKPRIASSPLLSGMVDRFLAEETGRLRNVLWIPLGDIAAEALISIRGAGAVDPGRILHGLPHASGANAERIAYFLGRKHRKDLSNRTSATAIDERLSRLRAQVRDL